MYVELDITQREWKRSRNGHFFLQLFCHHNVIENCIVLIVKENINYWYAANQHSELMGQIWALSWGIFKSIKQPWKTLKDGCSRFEVMHSSIKSFIRRSIYVAEINEPHTIDRTGGKTGGRTDRLKRFGWSRRTTGMRMSSKHAVERQGQGTCLLAQCQTSQQLDSCWFFFIFHKIQI